MEGKDAGMWECSSAGQPEQSEGEGITLNNSEEMKRNARLESFLDAH